MAESEAQIGSRIESDGFYATIGYIGNVQSTSGTWYGVEWDDASRGRHDGTADGVQYFRTTQPKAGSFIRPVKCRLGVGFMSAARERYGRGAGDEKEMYVAGGPRKKQTAVVLVGADKVNALTSKLNLLQRLIVRESYINGPDNDFVNRFHSLPNLHDLDISLNLFNKWDQVLEITSIMPNLVDLNVSSNRLMLPETTTKTVHQLPVKVLYMNRMRYSWADIVQVLHFFPSLKTLHACFNVITIVDSSSVNFNNVTLLNLEGNSLRDWKNVLALDFIPKLDTLILNNTDLDSVIFPDGTVTQPTRYLSRVQSLSLDNNGIDSWSSINQLNRLPSLISLRFASNPLVVQFGKASTHHIIIAKINNLKHCNGTAVLASERKGAELDYLKMFGPDWKTAGGRNKTGGVVEVGSGELSEEFILAHPRYEDIVQKRGAAEDSEMKVQSSALKNCLIAVRIDCPEDLTKKTCTKKIPPSITIQKVKMLVQRMYGIPDARTIRLTYSCHKLLQHSPEIELESDFREIGFYSIEDQDIIHVYW